MGTHFASKNLPVSLVAPRPIRISAVMGSRRDVIGLGPVIAAARKNPGMFQMTLINSGTDTGIESYLRLFGIKDFDRDFHLGGRAISQASLVSGTLKNLNSVLSGSDTDIILLHGDSNVAFSGALFSKYSGIPAVHIRNYCSMMMSSSLTRIFARRTIEDTAFLQFCPTTTPEGLQPDTRDPSKVIFAGSTIVDALAIAGKKVTRYIDKKLLDKRFVLVSIKNPDNFGDPFKYFLFALKAFAHNFADHNVVLSLPEISTLHRAASSILGSLDNVIIQSPYSYRNFTHMMRYCSFIVSDSQNMQIETAHLGKPMVFANSVEIPQKTTLPNLCFGSISNWENLFRVMSELARDRKKLASYSVASRIFGDGSASAGILEKIAAVLRPGERFLSHGDRCLALRADAPNPLKKYGGVRWKAVRSVPQQSYLSKFKRCHLGTESWLLDSGIQSRSSSRLFRGGFFAYLDPAINRYSFIYPEITGYGLTALANIAKHHQLSKTIHLPEKIYSHSLAAFNWLERNSLSIESTPAEGACIAFPSRLYPDQDRAGNPLNDLLYTFDNGMIMDGLMNMFSITGNKRFAEMAENIFYFLMKMRRRDGSLLAFFDTVRAEGVSIPRLNWSMFSGSYHAKLAMPLLKYSRETGNSLAMKMAVSLCDNAVEDQDASGRFFTNMSERGTSKSTQLHPHCYTAEGLLYAALHLKKTDPRKTERYMGSAVRAVKWIFDIQNQTTGGIPQAFSECGVSYSERSDTLAQALRLACLINLHQPHTIDENRIHLLANKLLLFYNNSGNRRIKGGFVYGFGAKGEEINHCNSWCTMFAMQALHLYFNMLKGKAKTAVEETKMII
ncbi:MAG: UDP-N-acetylglucosamine 2-epimerase [Candidatus Saganbacteria bacterium]|nr:UDP-N-acetylglucosamine 2-epimerase [Candidatus Saganbacteria bacterium]